MLVFSAATPSAVKSLRHRRTVSSRTPNASAILELVQPASVWYLRVLGCPQQFHFFAINQEPNASSGWQNSRVGGADLNPGRG